MAASTYLGNEISGLSTRRNVDWGWILICAVAFFPIAATLHHGFFWASTCMLNPFGPDYSLETVAHWLTNDPSPTVAAIMVVTLGIWGRSFRILRTILAVFILAFLPLTLYVWDIPGTGRWICENFHDLKFALPGGLPLRGRHLYFLGAALFPLIYLSHLSQSHAGNIYAARTSA